MKTIRRITLLTCFVLALTAGSLLLGYEMGNPDPAVSSTEHASLPLKSSAVLAASALTSNPYLIADVAETASPAVVFISVEFPAPPQDDRSTLFNDPFFRFWFGDSFPFAGPGREAPRESAGTGFIVDEQGHILTNQHVVGDLEQGQKIRVRITTSDYEGEVEASLIGADYQLDLAVLKINKPKGLKTLPILPLGDSDSSRPGEFVIAIGNPYGKQFEHTVTIGVLSAKGRQIAIPDYDRNVVKHYENLMQTDAAINPGNSGGPLLNIRGEVIGINTAVNAGAQGIGFAIPINTAKDVITQLIEKGKVERGLPWIGIEYDSAADYFGVKDAIGIVVLNVLEGDPADKAGLQRGDYIYGVDSDRINGSEDFVRKVQKMQPGQHVTLHIKRQGQKMQIPLILGERSSGNSSS